MTLFKIPGYFRYRKNQYGFMSTLGLRFGMAAVYPMFKDAGPVMHHSQHINAAVRNKPFQPIIYIIIAYLPVLNVRIVDLEVTSLTFCDTTFLLSKGILILIE
ncbi:hypothetical protein [Mucilaginibacter aquatilis]|uniref:Uncharacterized protein n=1 Tax=Mucilaginibacter aquatilis TaxID=1517760 RepID=A0A6I4I631_9SPHI|nr:hypothetical protein [Mucilaginibacter aquatilis]MVN90580.1 hypothetical protein [Mucilaginibacter aquatilis]